MKNKEQVTTTSEPGSTLEAENVVTRKADRRKHQVKFGIDPEELEYAPKIEKLFSQALGGVPEVIRIMRFSTKPIIKEFLATYDKATDEQHKKIPLEGFALAAKVNPQDLSEAMMECLRQYTLNQIAVMGLTRHRWVMKARLAAAREYKGVRDRNAIDSMLGLSGKKQQVETLNEMEEIAADAPPPEEAAAPIEQEDDPDLDVMFPRLSTTQKTLSDKPAGEFPV